MRHDDNNLGLPEDPLEGFATWLADAERGALPEPTAMTLATATREARPSARIVLFKGLSQGLDGRKGIRFFTNYTSRKSEELIDNPFASVVFHWTTLQRQIRMEGRVEKLSSEESDQYFQSRDRGSRIGAWASPQSQRIDHRFQLEELVQRTEERFKQGEIPCPPHWGGWRLIPNRVEFWQGKSHRLHDRFIYEWASGVWQSTRLAP